MSLTELIPVALSSIMKSSPDMMFVKDIGLHYISASPSTLEITGCSNEREIVGKTDSELFEKSLWEKYVHDDIEIIKTKQPKINDRDFISTKDGETHNVLTSKYPITDENEKVIGLYGVSRDITKIQQNEDQLRTISNNIPGGIFCIEFGYNTFRIIYINDVFFNAIDYSREKYIENCMKDPYFIIHEDDKAGLKKVFTDYYKNPSQNQFIKYEFRCKNKNGNYRWFSIRGNIEQIATDQFRLNAVFIDIDEMKKTENKLLVSREEYKVASQLSDNIICRYSIKHKTITLPAETAKLSFLPEVLQGIPDSEENIKTISPDTLEPYLNFYKKINEGKEKGLVVYRNLLPTGWKWISAKFLSIKNSEGASVSAIISFSDITELRDKEITYEKWNQNIKGRALDSYTLFCCNIDKKSIFDRKSGTLIKMKFDEKPRLFNSHVNQYLKEYVYEDDKKIFTNYLNSENLRKEYEKDNYSSTINFRENVSDGEYKWLKLTVDLVKDPTTDSVEAHMLFEDIDNIKRKELLIRERAENDPLTGILNRISFAEKVDNIIRTSKPGDQHALLMLDVDYFKQINDVLGHAEGDKALIEISKLLKSMARSYDLVGRLGGDEFFVFLQNIPNDIIAAKRAKNICEKTQRTYGEDIHISSSIGISVFPKDGKNFEQLYKKADQVLYSVKELGRNNFAFYGEHIEERIMQSSDMKSVIKHKPHILIVEDNPVDYTLIASLFDESYIVEHSKNGDEAMNFLRRYGHSISLILLDLIMPKMNGFEVLDKLKKDANLKSIPVIIVSGDMRRETCLKAIRAGATDFITKPVDSSLILQRVKAILEYKK